jgi:hypothetical protein
MSIDEVQRALQHISVRGQRIPDCVKIATFCCKKAARSQTSPQLPKYEWFGWKKARRGYAAGWGRAARLEEPCRVYGCDKQETELSGNLGIVLQHSIPRPKRS